MTTSSLIVNLEASMLSLKFRFVLILLTAILFFGVFEFLHVSQVFRFEISDLSIFLITLWIVAASWEGNRLLVDWLDKFIAPDYTDSRTMWKRFLATYPLATLYSVGIVVLLPAGIFCIVFDVAMADIAAPTRLFSVFGFLIMNLLHTANALHYYMNKWRDTLLEAERFKKMSVESQFEALRTQVNPHFLFNSLNTLASLVQSDRETAAEFIHRLSSVYRYMLQHQNDELVTVAEELEFANSYLYLLKTRFDRSIRIGVDIEPRIASQSYIPPVTLQLLIENAIKHNIVSRGKPLTVELFLEGEEWVVVRNTLQRKSQRQPSTRIGLSNIRSRYRYLSRRELQVSDDGEFFTVRLPLLFSE